MVRMRRDGDTGPTEVNKPGGLVPLLRVPLILAGTVRMQGARGTFFATHKVFQSGSCRRVRARSGNFVSNSVVNPTRN